MRSLKILAFVALAFALLLVAEMSQSVAESFLAGDEAQMTGMVNDHRGGHGAPSAQTNDALRMVARRQAQRMVMAGYIHHNPNLRREADAAIPGWLLLGENVGVGQDTGSVQQAFLNSPAHHKNIDTRDFNIVGVGAMANDQGDKYYTQNYAKWDGNRPVAAPPRRAASTPPPVVRARPTSEVRGAQATPAPATPAPTPAPTPVPTPVPTEEPPSRPAELADVNLLNGLFAMIQRFFAKLAFWR